MSDLGKKGNLGVVDGVIRTAYADGEGGIVIKSEVDLTDFTDHTKEQFNARSGKQVGVIVYMTLKIKLLRCLLRLLTLSTKKA